MTSRHKWDAQSKSLLKIVVIINVLVLIVSVINQFLRHNNPYLAVFLYAILVIVPVDFLSGFELAFRRQPVFWAYLALMPLLQLSVQSVNDAQFTDWRSSVFFYVAIAAGGLLGYILSLFRKKS